VLPEVELTCPCLRRRPFCHSSRKSLYRTGKSKDDDYDDVEDEVEDDDDVDDDDDDAFADAIVPPLTFHKSSSAVD
jgi:hypothetical protein